MAHTGSMPPNELMLLNVFKNEGGPVWAFFANFTLFGTNFKTS